MIKGWTGLQQMSKAALGALVVVLLVVIGIVVTGNDAPSPGVLAGFVFAAAAIVVYTEYTAGKQG